MSYQRIVCLVPSLTELLVDLEVGERLIGRTRFCIHPENKVGDIQIIGGTKTPNTKKILGLEPDLIIANHEENRKEDIEKLQEHVKVLVTEIDAIAEVISAIREIGRLVDKEDKAQQIVSEIKSLLDHKPDVESLSTAYFIWKDPWMVAAAETYIDSVLQHYNLKNVYENQTRYPEIELEELKKRNPKLILLSSEPYPFKEKHLQEIENLCPNAKVELINGEWFSWYGSGMIKAFENLNTWRKSLSLDK